MENEENKNEVRDVLKDVKVEEKSEKSKKNDVAPEKQNDKGYFGYYLFVFISAIIGFIIVFFATRFAIDEAVKNGNTGLTAFKPVLSVVVPALAVILFMLISLVFKNFLKRVFLSEIFMYLYIGFLTTAVNLIAFKVLLDELNPSMIEENPNWKAAELIAFIISLIFAFIANKLFVFKSFNFAPVKFFQEFGLFTGGRICTELLNVIIMYIMIDKMGKDEFMTKVIACVIVIIVNYLLSKFVIFKKVKKEVENKELNSDEENKDK